MGIFKEDTTEYEVKRMYRVSVCKNDEECSMAVNDKLDVDKYWICEEEELAYFMDFLEQLGDIGKIVITPEWG